MSFDYVSPAGFITVTCTVLAAVPVALFGMRCTGSGVVVAIRRFRSGPVNDYASYLVGGLLVVVLVLTRSVLA